jgi:hypothetical protein
MTMPATNDTRSRAAIACDHGLSHTLRRLVWVGSVSARWLVNAFVSADWVPGVTREAMVRLVAHAAKVGLPNTEEFTFRALFMAAAHDLLDRPRFQTEWARFDLLVQLGEHATLIEFKYYLLRRTVGLRGELLGYKGGAGLKNEAEFRACVRKVRNAVLPAGVDDRRLILLYERDYTRQSRHSFHLSYGHLSPGSEYAEVTSLTEGPLEARVLRIQPR